MLQGTLRIDKTQISTFTGLFEIFASDVYLEEIQLIGGWNEDDKSFMLLSASKVSI